MEKHESLSIVLTMIVSFALAFAYLYRPRIVTQPVPQRTNAAIAALVAARVPGGTRSQSAPTGSSHATMSRQQAQVHAVPDVAVTTPGGMDDPPLPIIFSVATKPVIINDDEGPSRREIQPDGILLNSSDKRIPLTVIEVNLPTMETTQAQLVLQPGGAMHFGRDRGLKMASGDQLTLRAAGFQDLTKTIP